MNKPATPRTPTSRTTKGGAIAAFIGLVGAGTAAIVVPETKQWEGKSNKAYLDIAKVPTICFGDTADVRMGQVASDAECDERLYRQLYNHAKPVLQCVPALSAPERQSQRAASIVFAYNIGTGGFCNSTAARRFNARDWRGGCEAFMAWNKIKVSASHVASYQKRGEKCSRDTKGVWRCTVKGLTNRRTAERKICLEGLPT